MAKTKAQIEFEAVTSDFTSGIKSMDQSLGTLRKELNLNSAELKGNADDVDLLAKRKEILQQESEATANKIELMKNKLAEAERLFGSSSNEVRQLSNKILDTQTSFQKIQNEISQTDGKLEKLENGLNENEQELKQVEKASEDLKGGFSVLKGAIADLVADGVQQLTGSLKDLAVESETSMSKFQAQTGLSNEEMEKFEGTIEDIYSKNFGESISDIANAMAEVKLQTRETDPSKLQKLTENAITLRDTFDYDIQESMRAVNMLTTQFGISGEEAFNLIVQGTQKGLNKNGDFLDSLNEYSVHYKQLGYDADEFITSLILGTENGAFSVDKVGDAMKEFGIRTKDGSEATKQAFKDLGLNANKMTSEFAKGGESAKNAMDKTMQALIDMDDPVKKNQVGVALFGTMWEDLGEDVLNGATSAEYYTDIMYAGIDKSKQSMEELTQVRYDDVISQLQEMGRSIQMDVLVPIAEDLLPVLKDGLSWLKDNLNWLLPTITGIGIAIGTYFVVSKFLSFISVLKSLFTLVKSGTGIMTALNTVMALNPIALIVAAIVGLIAVFVLLWNKCDGFREFWINLWNKIKEIFGIVVEAVKTGFQAFADFLGNVWNGIKNGFQNFMNFLGTVGNWINTNVIQPTINFFKGLWNGIQAVWDGIVLGIRIFIGLVASIFDAALQIILLPFTFIWENCKQYVFQAWEWIKNAISTAINFISGIITTVFTAISTFFSTIWNGIKTTFTNIWNAIVNFLTPIINNIKTKITNTFNAIKETISNILNAIKETITNIWNNIKETISNVVNAIKEKVTTIFNSVKEKVTSVFNSIKTTVSNVWNGIKTNVSNVATSVKDKVVNTFNTLKSKVSSIFNKVKDSITKPINTAKDKVKGVVNTMKGFFDFEFKTPKIKKPDFGITPKGWKVGDLLEGKIPKLSIKWNKEGAIFRKPTLFDTRGGYQGVGEAGAEAVLPIEKLENWMNNGFNHIASSNSYANDRIERLIEVAEDILAKDTNIYMDKEKVGQSMASTNDNISGQRYNFKNRGVLI